MALSSQDDRVKIGLLHSLSGTMALSERTLLDTEIFAIETINKEGGVLGRQIEPIIADGASDAEIFAKRAEDLISAGAVSVFGCWTSASRKAVKVVVDTTGNLLWYPVQYEGLEESTHIVYTGSCANQQIAPAVDWLLAHAGPSAYLIGSDYIFPRAANKLVRSHLKQTSDQSAVIAECYVPLGLRGLHGTDR